MKNFSIPLLSIFFSFMPISLKAAFTKEQKKEKNKFFKEFVKTYSQYENKFFFQKNQQGDKNEIKKYIYISYSTEELKQQTKNLIQDIWKNFIKDIEDYNLFDITNKPAHITIFKGTFLDENTYYKSIESFFKKLSKAKNKEELDCFGPNNSSIAIKLGFNFNSLGKKDAHITLFKVKKNINITTMYYKSLIHKINQYVDSHCYQKSFLSLLRNDFLENFYCSFFKKFNQELYFYQDSFCSLYLYIKNIVDTLKKNGENFEKKTKIIFDTREKAISLDDLCNIEKINIDDLKNLEWIDLEKKIIKIKNKLTQYNHQYKKHIKEFMDKTCYNFKIFFNIVRDFHYKEKDYKDLMERTMGEIDLLESLIEQTDITKTIVESIKKTEEIIQKIEKIKKDIEKIRSKTIKEEKNKTIIMKQHKKKQRRHKKRKNLVYRRDIY